MFIELKRGIFNLLNFLIVKNSIIII